MHSCKVINIEKEKVIYLPKSVNSETLNKVMRFFKEYPDRLCRPGDVRKNLNLHYYAALKALETLSDLGLIEELAHKDGSLYRLKK